ncbi:MAG: hypothetical protein KKB59_10395 [Spirochaetes bacterium]|nr:hypothetical protein [Spirochaetota bacterium]
MIKRGLHKTLAEVGKIKTGFKGDKITAKSGTTFQPPKKFDFFMVTTTERDPKTGNLIPNAEVMTKLGGEPRELKIRLPFDSIDKNFFTQYQAYSGGVKLCAGDGETAERRGVVTVKGDRLETVGEDRASVECDYETCPIAQAGKCKVSGILSCFLPQSGDLGGVYKYRTHSWNGVSSILGALEYFAEQTGGILQGMPLKLVLVKKTTEEHGNINYATVVIDGEEIRGLRRLAIDERESRKLLGYDIAKAEAEAVKSGFLDDTDAPEDVEAEFYSYANDAPERPEKGTGADDLSAKLAARAEAEDVEAIPVGTDSGELGLEESAPAQSAPVAPARGPATPPATKPAANTRPAAYLNTSLVAANPRPATAPKPAAPPPASAFPEGEPEPIF